MSRIERQLGKYPLLDTGDDIRWCHDANYTYPCHLASVGLPKSYLYLHTDNGIHFCSHFPPRWQDRHHDLLGPEHSSRDIQPSDPSCRPRAQLVKGLILKNSCAKMKELGF